MRLYESQLTFKANKTWISRKTLGFIPGTMSSKVSIPAYNYHINSILLSIQSVDICWVILSKTLPDLGDGSCLMWGWQSELSWYHMLWWNQFSISFYDLQTSPHLTTSTSACSLSQTPLWQELLRPIYSEGGTGGTQRISNKNHLSLSGYFYK